MKTTCSHLHFQVYARVDRIFDRDTPDADTTMPDRFSVDVHVRCTVCGVRFEFIGPDMGLMPDRPMVDPSRLELRAPIRPNAHVTTLMAGDPETAWPGQPIPTPSLED